VCVFNFHCSMSLVDDVGGLESGPGTATTGTGAALAKLGDTRTMLAAQLTALTAERGDLLEEKLALGKKRGDAERKTAITARLADIAECTGKLQQFWAAASFTLREGPLGSQQQQQQPQQQQPQQPQQQQQQQQQLGNIVAFQNAFKRLILFPPWSNAGF
jgi:hypothetical protein